MEIHLLGVGRLRRLSSWHRYVAILLCLVLLGLALPVQAETPPIALVLDGQKLTMDVPPMIVQGRTLVPVRAIMEALGARVEWDQETRTATVLHEGHVVVLPDGSSTAWVDGQAVTLDVPAQIHSGRMLLPVRFLVEATGGEVEWLAAEQTVVLAVKDEALKGQLRVEKANRFLLSTPPSLRSIASEIGFSLTNPTRGEFAADGVVHLAGKVSPLFNGTSLVVEVVSPFPAATRETALPIRDGAFTGEIHLADGAGIYSIRLHAPRSPGDETFYMVTSLRVQNVSTRSRQVPFYPREYARSGVVLELPTSGQIAVDTTFPVSGTADPKLNGRFVWLQAEQGREKWSSYVQIQDGKLIGDAHLGGGPGLHWVSVLLQTDPGVNRYMTIAQIPVMNTSAAVARQPLVVMPFGQQVQFKLDPLPDAVPDGYLPVSGQVDPGLALSLVRVRVKHDGKVDDVLLPVSDGSFSGQVPLSMGAGEYEVSFWVPRNSHELQEAASARVTNQAVQVVRGFRYTAHALERRFELTAPATDPFVAQSKLTLAGWVGVVSEEFPYVLAVTRFGDLEARYRLPVRDGQFRGDAELRFGAGTYEVVLYSQVRSTQLAELMRFTVATETAKDERDLLPSVGIESDHPAIVALAKELTDGKPVMDAARAIFEWTAQNVQYDRTKAASWRVDPDEGAERTLRTRMGVCRDYAALAVALLRAAGIKSHMVTGKAGSGFAVTGHAWVEFYDGERWVEMDPTFASGVVVGTEFVPQYDARYFDPAPEFLKTTHVREGIQY